MSDFEHLLVRLANGDFDDQINRVDAIVKQRIAVTRELHLAEIKKGDRVRTVRIKPKYMSGLEGTVVGVCEDRFEVLLDAEVRESLIARGRDRYLDHATSTTSTVPRACVEKIA